MSTQIPERLTNFNAYNDGNKLVGTVDVEMPEIAYMTDTISGAGIAGEIETTVIGHLQSMTTTLTWRTVTKAAGVLAAPRVHAIELRGSQEVFDQAAGTKRAQPLRIAMRVQPKNLSLGSLEVGSTTGSESEFEVSYLKVALDGEEFIEIDKYNFICKIDGTDYLADVRDNI